jgi:uncharacterized protein (TIGR02466 family)
MSTARTHLMFSTPVIVDQVEDADAINAGLLKLIEERRRIDEGVVRSNRGGWHSKQDFAHWSGEPGRKLLLHVLNLARDHTQIAADAGTAINWAAEAWANVSGAGALNNAHVHGGAFWSAVYYVRAPASDSGQLVLHDPRMPALRMYAPMLRFKGAGPEQVARIKPQSGMLVMFPSWLLHSVDPWQGEGERVSIAFNIFAQSPAIAKARKDAAIAAAANAKAKPKSKSRSR